MKNYESPGDALADLKKRGYEADFEAHPLGLYSEDLDLRLDPEEFKIDETYRFNGNSGPDDNSYVFAISSASGVKGTMVDETGTFNKSFGD